LFVGTAHNTVVTATYSDSNTINVTGNATYDSNNNAVATVSASGVVTGVSPGTALITVTYDGQTATTSVTVTPPNNPPKPQVLTKFPTGIGTYILIIPAGAVKDAAGNALSGDYILNFTTNISH